MGGKNKNHKSQRYHGNSHKDSYIVRTTNAVDSLMQEAFASGFQKACDLLALTLHDAEVMHGDAFGENRINRVLAGIIKYELIYRGAWSTGREADYLQERLDSELRTIFQHRDTVPFTERHNLVFIPGYSKPRKDWV